VKPATVLALATVNSLIKRPHDRGLFIQIALTIGGLRTTRIIYSNDSHENVSDLQ
jgi:hypothetical protein